MDRVVVADDHPLFRAAVASAVARALPGAQIDECDSLAGAREALKTPADLVLLDLKLSDCDGFSGLVALRSEFPATPVVVVSASEDVPTIRRALAFGASGFIPKSASLNEMVEALTRVLAGDVAAPVLFDDVPVGDLEKRIASLTPSQLKILTGLQPRCNRGDHQGAPDGRVPQAGSPEPDPGRHRRPNSGSRPQRGVKLKRPID